MELFFNRGDQQNPVESPLDRLFKNQNALSSMGERTAQQNPFTQQQALQAIAPRNQWGNPTIPPAPAPAGMPQGGGLASALNSPEMLMASTAMNNIFAARKDQQTQDPIRAYQQAVMAQATHGQNMKRGQQQQQIGEQTIEMNKQKLDPFFDYNEAKRTGVIPPEMTYAEFQRTNYRSSDLTAPQKHLAQARVMKEAIDAEQDPVKKKALEDEYAMFQEYVRKSDSFAGGGGSQYMRTADGRIIELVGSDTAIGRNVDEKTQLTRAEVDERGQATRDSEFRMAASAIPEVEQALQDTIDLRDQIKSGEFQKTGFFEGRFTKFTDRESAELQGKAVMQALRNLQITNLAPVTEKEIELIGDLYASVLKDPEANLGALDNAINLIVKKIAIHDSMEEYWMSNGGTLRDYGIDARYKRRKAKDEDPEIP